MSLFDFIDPGTPVFVQSAAWLAARVKAVCSETISEAALIADEGDRTQWATSWTLTRSTRASAGSRP